MSAISSCQLWLLKNLGAECSLAQLQLFLWVNICKSVALNAFILVFCKTVSLNYCRLFVCHVICILRVNAYIYVTIKLSAYNPTQGWWLETLYAHSAAASLKVNGVKYNEKNYRMQRILFWWFLPIQSNFSRNYYICYSCMLY